MLGFGIRSSLTNVLLWSSLASGSLSLATEFSHFPIFIMNISNGAQPITPLTTTQSPFDKLSWYKLKGLVSGNGDIMFHL